MRRVRDRAKAEELFPVWRYHPFFTNSPSRPPSRHHPPRHAIIETIFADLIDGPLAHLPSGRFAANSAWAICAAITHNLLRAAGTLPARSMPWPAAPPSPRHRPPPARPPATPPGAAPTRALALGEPVAALWNRVFGHRLAPPVRA